MNKECYKIKCKSNESDFEQEKTEEWHQQNTNDTHHKNRGEQMRQFNFLRMFSSYQYATAAEIKNLMIELLKVRSAFMIYKRIGNQSHVKACFFHSDAKLNIFCKAIKGEALRFIKNFSGNTHIKTSRLKPPQPFLTSTNTACREY